MNVSSSFVNEGEYYFSVDDLSLDDARSLFVQLGGFTRLAVSATEDELVEYLAKKGDKVVFGVSVYDSYDTVTGEKILKFLNDFKRLLKQRGLKSRFVTAKTKILNEGTLIHNNIIENGAEILLFVNRDGSIELARTIALQDVESFVQKDREKPYTDVKMGVLPPKLARIMINVSSMTNEGYVWDAFCGSGNIALEALHLGVNVLASDISNEAVNGTRENIAWFKKTYNVEASAVVKRINVKNTYDIKKFQEFLYNVRAIVSEPFMGVAQRSIVSDDSLRELQRDYIQLVKAYVKNIATSVKAGTSLILVVPEYKTADGFQELDIESELSDWVESIPCSNKHLHWERANSIIRRRIARFVFK
jgi:tRNA (guanine10-N2)-dimethyltransferase